MSVQDVVIPAEGVKHTFAPGSYTISATNKTNTKTGTASVVVPEPAVAPVLTATVNEATGEVTLTTDQPGVEYTVDWGDPA